MFVKTGFSFGKPVAGFAEDGHDRDGPLAVEGRLLSGHEVSSRGVPGGPAGRLKASTGGGSRLAGRAAPGSCRSSEAVAEVGVDLAGDVPLQAADDLFLRQSLRGAPLGAGAGGRGTRAGAEPGDYDPPQRVVGLAVPAAVEPVPGDLA